MSYFKHESAYVDEPCSIGEGTKIWNFSHVMKNAVIGKNCNLGQNVHVASGVVIGDNVKIQNNVSIYTGTIIEDFVFLGPSCVLTNVTNPRSEINRHSRSDYRCQCDDHMRDHHRQVCVYSCWGCFGYGCPRLCPCGGCARPPVRMDEQARAPAGKAE
jgi:NDP-sugar pyrophosphorylase family protein